MSDWSQPPLEGLELGTQLRDTGIARVLTAQDFWRQAAYFWIARQPQGRELSSLDLIESVGMPSSPNAVGAVMRSASTLGLIEPTGRYIQSTRPSRHAAIVRVWKAT
jgi:alkylated DNA nucleotide flippase Atl1